MSPIANSLRDFARRLIVIESRRHDATTTLTAGAVRVCDQLRTSLAKLAGMAGFHSLMSRAVAMAKAEYPAIQGVAVRDDGSLEGLDSAGTAEGADGEAGIVIVAQLIGLLVTFIGEPLTMRLVRDVWADAPAIDGDAERGQ
jgi:hypothetical protein